MRDYSPKRRTAVVFTGSGTSGAYHAGVLRVLDEKTVIVDYERRFRRDREGIHELTPAVHAAVEQAFASYLDTIPTGKRASSRTYTVKDVVRWDAFETPFGKLYSTNITPDPDTGIGKWTEEQFARALREGVRPDGAHLYPAFPYTAYTKLSDEDVSALWAYMKVIKPVNQQTPENEMSFPANQRWALGISSSNVCRELGAISMTRSPAPVSMVTRFGFGPLSRITVSLSIRSDGASRTPAACDSGAIGARSRMSAVDSPLTQKASPSRL